MGSQPYRDNSQGDVAEELASDSWDKVGTRRITSWDEDNQFGRKYLFKFDRITATELETGLSIVLASLTNGECPLRLTANVHVQN